MRLRRTGALALVLVVAAGLAGCGALAATPSGGQGARAGRRPQPSAAGLRVLPDSFVSFVPACGCARRTKLEVFSLRTGRLLRSLGRVSRHAGWRLGTLAATDRGQLFYTATSGPVCAYKGDSAECPRWIPDSCVNRVARLVSGAASVTALRLPGSEALRYAVPNPAGSAIALTVAPCLSRRGTTGLLVRALTTGRTYPVYTTSNPCDGFGPPSWSADAGRLVFAFDRASGPPIEMAGGYGCPGGQNRLAIVRLRRSRTPEVRMVAPQRGCAFSAAAFDRSGIAAVEGCTRGSPPGFAETSLGRAYLLQLTDGGRLVRRWSLRLGLEQAVVAPIPRTGAVLITQDQPANEPYPERDWVWELDGTNLRAVGHYRAKDAAEVLAVPW